MQQVLLGKNRKNPHVSISVWLYRYATNALDGNMTDRFVFLCRLYFINRVSQLFMAHCWQMDVEALRFWCPRLIKSPRRFVELTAHFLSLLQGELMHSIHGDTIGENGNGCYNNQWFFIFINSDA